MLSDSEANRAPDFPELCLLLTVLSLLTFEVSKVIESVNVERQRQRCALLDMGAAPRVDSSHQWFDTSEQVCRPFLLTSYAGRLFERLS